MSTNNKKCKFLLLLLFSFFLFIPIVLADDEDEEEPKVIKQKIDINFNVGIGNFIKDGNGLVTENRNNKFTVYDECDDTNGHEKAIYINPQKDNEIKMTFYGKNMTNVWLKCWENNAPAPEVGLEDHFDYMTATGAFGGYTFKANLKEAALTNNGEMIDIDNSQSFEVGDTSWFFLITVVKYLDEETGKTNIEYSPCSIPYVLYGDIIDNESHDQNNMVTACKLDEYPVHTIASYTSLYSKILTRFNDKIYYPGEVNEETIYYTVSPSQKTDDAGFGELIEKCDDEDEDDCTFIAKVNSTNFYYISDFTKNYSSVAAKTASLPSHAPKVGNKEETGRFVAIEYFYHDETKNKYEITFREFNLKYLDVILAQGIPYFSLIQTLNLIDCMFNISSLS